MIKTKQIFKINTLFRNPFKLVVFLAWNPAKHINMKHFINIRDLCLTSSRTCILFVIVHQIMSSAYSARKQTSCVRSTTHHRREKLGGCNYVNSTREISVWSQVRIIKLCGLISNTLSPWYLETSHVLSFYWSRFAVHMTPFRCVTKCVTNAACHVMSCCVR